MFRYKLNQGDKRLQYKNFKTPLKDIECLCFETSYFEDVHFSQSNLQTQYSVYQISRFFCQK